MSESKQKKSKVGASRTAAKSGGESATTIQKVIPPARNTAKAGGRRAKVIEKELPELRTAKSGGQTAKVIERELPELRTAKSGGQTAKVIERELPELRTAKSGGRTEKAVQKNVLHQPVSKKPSLAQQPISVPYRIKILSQLLARRLQRRLDPFDLTPAHFMVLNCLWGQDGLAISDIGEKVQQVGGTMTGVIDRMEERNLIVRKRDAEDRRVWRAWLTDKGKKLFSKLPPVMAQAREQLLSGISESEIAQLVETLDKIIVNAQAEFE